MYLAPTVSISFKYLLRNKLTGRYWDGAGFNASSQNQAKWRAVSDTDRIAISYTYENVVAIRYEVETPVDAQPEPEAPAKDFAQFCANKHNPAAWSGRVVVAGVRYLCNGWCDDVRSIRRYIAATKRVSSHYREVSPHRKEWARVVAVIAAARAAK